MELAASATAVSAGQAPRAAAAATEAGIPHSIPVDLLRFCIHCGLCLGACPTYREAGNENDSPRGRLYIIKAFTSGRLNLVPNVTRHLDLCLGCRACETACPAGVRYGAVLEPARELLLRTHPPGLGGRALRTFFLRFVFPRPRVLGLLTSLVRFYQKSGLRSAAHRLGLLRLLPRRLRELEAMQPELSGPAFLKHAPDVFPAEGGAPKKRVAFFTGCVMDQFMGDIHRATVKVLQAHGVEVLAVKGQVCCGAIMVHLGEPELARGLARRNIAVFRNLGVDAIVNNSAGCGAQLKEYRLLLPGDAEAAAFSGLVKDVSEVLCELQPLRPLKPLEKTLCYDEPCHLLHAQRVSAQPKALLQRIPGLKWVALPDADFCCGSAGVYNLVQPEMAAKVLARKIEAIKSTRAEIVATGNPGCLLQIQHGCRQAGLTCEVLHPLEVLARQM